jgi:hypothetical protein
MHEQKLAMEILTVNVAIVVVIDAVAGDLTGVGPHLIDQIRVQVVDT